MSTVGTVESAGPRSQIADVLIFYEPYSNYKVHLMAVKRIWPWATDSLSPGIDKEVSS
jgi:hypothetical protein